MAESIPASCIAKAMGDDEMVAALCDDRPDINEQLRANDALSPDEEGWQSISLGQAIVMLIIAALIGAMLAIGRS
jgi:hypothetical protein